MNNIQPQQKKPAATPLALCQTNEELQLFLSALLGDQVGAAETQQQGDAAAEGSVLVTSLVVRRQVGQHGAVAIAVVHFLGSTALEQAAALVAFGKAGETQSEDDCDCYH